MLDKRRPYMPKDVLDNINKKEIENYLGAYDPEMFWKEMGKFYHKRFDAEAIQLNLQALVSRVNMFEPKSILEVGCGFGRCLFSIRLSLGDEFELVGIDFSETMLEHFERIKAEFFAGRGPIKALRADAANIPFEDNRFDLTYTHVVLTHIPPNKVLRAIGEISRVTKNTIVHIERFHFLHEHSHPHRWSHNIVDPYLELGWKLHEGSVVDPKWETKAFVLVRSDEKRKTEDRDQGDQGLLMNRHDRVGDAEKDGADGGKEKL